MSETKGPNQWAYRLTHVLNQALGEDHFPIDVKMVARDFSHRLYPEDPISAIMSGSLPGFEGALVLAPPGKKGWGIIYNEDVRSKGRINFTLAHEFGHYLCHRLDGPPEFRCTKKDTYRWDDEYAVMEREANQFAANLLMPLDDFRRQIPGDQAADIDMISSMADRYGVSFMAACLRWISYTSVPAVFVLSRDGFIKWARSSKAALKRGAYFKRLGGPVEVPSGALANGPLHQEAKSGILMPSKVWFGRECREASFSADSYDYVFSLVLVGERPFQDLEDV